MGVLVAVSIPIFTAQLKKARLATNQANARAAYAAAAADKLLSDSVTSRDTNYTYTVASATVTSSDTSQTTGVPISAWNVDSSGVLDSGNAGDKVAATWELTIGSDGALKGIKGK